MEHTAWIHRSTASPWSNEKSTSTFVLALLIFPSVICWSLAMRESLGSSVELKHMISPIAFWMRRQSSISICDFLCIICDKPKSNRAFIRKGKMDDSSPTNSLHLYSISNWMTSIKIINTDMEMSKITRLDTLLGDWEAIHNWLSSPFSSFKNL